MIDAGIGHTCLRLSPYCVPAMAMSREERNVPAREDGDAGAAEGRRSCRA